MTAKEQRKFQEAVAAQFAREKQQALARYENALSAMSPVRGASHPVVSSKGFRPGGTAFFGGSSGAGSVADEITWEAEELTPPSNIKLDASTAYPALYLLTYAAGLQGDDKAFLVQQAGFAMQRGEFALNVPEVGAAKVVAEVPQFIAREEKVLAQQQRFAKLRSEWVGAANKEEDLELLESTLIHDVVEKNVAEAKEVLTKQEPTAATPPADEPTDDLLKRAEALLARTQSNLATVTTEKQQLEAEKKRAAKDVQNAVEERNALLSQ